LKPLAIDSLKPTELPAPPQEALRVVQACAQPEVDAQALAELVGCHPVLSAELLRISNSAYFGFASEVTSIARAVTVLGNRALRNLVLCVAMRDALRADLLPGLDVNGFWEGALRRAVAARRLASEVGLDEEESFTVGLLQDFGLLVLFYLMPHRISEWQRLMESPPDERYELERQLFHATHDRVGLQLAEVWALPAELAMAIGYHHDAPPQEVPESIRRLCQVAECADWVAAAFDAQDKRLAVQECHRLLADRFDLSAERIHGLLDGVSTSMEPAADALGFELGGQISLEEVLREANLRLVEENLSFQELTWRLEQALQERDLAASELHRELELAREVQRCLLPDESRSQTGVFGVNVSARAVSGDFYDHLRLHNGQVSFCLADVSGKGMNAALLMAKTASLFRCLGKGVHDPGKLLAMINREILETSTRGMFVTMVAGVWDPSTGRVRLANAGHLPVVQMKDSYVAREFEAAAPPLGIAPECAFSVEEFTLGEGSLYLYTDGLLEAKITSNRRLERDGLLELLAKYAKVPPVERLQRIVASVQKADGGIDDDLTLMVIEGANSSGLR
jgi:HD-like signal output (HDOD) protein/serine phosphatase RsbU (regulator of sigma subunit)